MIEIVFPDDWSERLAWLAAMATILIGLALMTVPRRAMSVMGLAPRNGGNRGVSEIRGPVGGMWVGMGLACIILAQPFTYFALGAAYFFAVVGRLLSFVADRSFGVYCVAVTVIEGLCAYFPLRFALEGLGLM